MQAKSAGARRQRRLTGQPSLPWHLEFNIERFHAMGSTTGSGSLVAPNLFCMVIWEYVEIYVLLFSSHKDFLCSTSSGSGLPGCGWSAGLELDAELRRRFPVRC